jgi:hypothetical protein
MTFKELTFQQQMETALTLYRGGEPVVLKDKSGNIIHGEETWNTTEHSKCRVIEGIDIGEWKRSQWPELLKGARQGWLKNKAAT